MKISVIIPVHNAEKYVRNAVESALQQLETGEILLVEDNSPDICLQKKWLLEFLLPVIYWQNQVTKTKNPKLKKSYQVAFEQALTKLEQHSLTPIFITQQQWLSWAEWMVSNFQRTSSAVEGRNGCLSQIHHNGRGISIKRLKALTVIHNFGLTRLDGTTAAERLFERNFPDLFEWIVSQMGDLPIARMNRKSSSANLLNLQSVPA